MKWMFVVYKKQNKQKTKQKNNYQPTTPFPLFLPGSGLVWSDIVLFSVCAVKSFDIHLVPTFGISVGEEELDAIRANCLEMWRLKGQVQINKVFNGLFYH